MKLKDLIDAVERELETSSIANKRARLSLAFTAKKSSDGQLECDFVEASSLSRARAEELHRLDVILDKRKPETVTSPKHQLAESVSPTLAKRSDFGPIRPSSAEVDNDDPDSPAYFRRLFPQS